MEKPINTLRIGIVGLDTAHVFLYAGLLNDPQHPAHVSGGRVVAAWAGGSPDWAMSQDLLAKQVAWIQAGQDIAILPSVEAVLKEVDAVMLLSLDGRVHLDLFRQIAPSRKPTYINKPLAANLAQAKAIAALAQSSGCPVFSSSSLRYAAAIQAERARGPVQSAEAMGPAEHETGQPGLFWYGIHMAEMLFALLGPGVESVQAKGSPELDVVTVRWKGGRTGVLRGYRGGERHDFGYSVERDQAVQGGPALADDAANHGLMAAMLEFFRTGLPPVKMEETLELIAFLEAANLSLKDGVERKVG